METANFNQMQGGGFPEGGKARQMQSIRKNLALLFLGSLLGAAIVLGIWTLQPSDNHGVASIVYAQTAEASPSLFREEMAVEIYQRLSPAVVNVTNRRAPTSGSVQGQFPDRGVGSGVIIDDQGRILTNNHVVDRADKLDVTLVDGTRIPAQLIGRDPGNDLALVQIGMTDRIRSKIAVATMGDSDQLRPGQVAIAIGNPFGFQSTMTSGIISSLGRTFPTDSGWSIRHMIQTDAAINPGNSGGPLINSTGQVIGVNTAIESPVRGSVGIGFAVPINVARHVLPDMMAGATVSHAWTGISGMTVNDYLAEALSLSGSGGVYVVHVLPDSPAGRAAVRGAVSMSSAQGDQVDQIPTGGDVVLSIDGQPLATADQLSDYVDSKQVGDQVTLTILRDGKTLQLQIVLDSWPRG